MSFASFRILSSTVNQVFAHEMMAHVSRWRDPFRLTGLWASGQVSRDRSIFQLVIKWPAIPGSLWWRQLWPKWCHIETHTLYPSDLKSNGWLPCGLRLNPEKQRTDETVQNMLRNWGNIVVECWTLIFSLTLSWSHSPFDTTSEPATWLNHACNPPGPWHHSILISCPLISPSCGLNPRSLTVVYP